MATLNALKQALRQKAMATTSCSKLPLSDTQYSDGYDILVQGSGWTIYQDFIIPQLSQLLVPLFNSRVHVSVLEIGPGPRGILGYLPSGLRRKIKRYAAYEPNSLFATRLEEWLCPNSETESPLPCLESPSDIHRIPFALDSHIGSGIGTGNGTSGENERFDVILFCHSMYGMKHKRKFIERALEMLVERPEGGMVVVFHRDGSLDFDGLVCHQTISFPTGLIRIADNDEAVVNFTRFVAGFVIQDVDAEKAIQLQWRKVCCALGRRDGSCPNELIFSAPNVMVAFTQHATALPELMAQVPFMKGDKSVKNPEARLHYPAAIVRPTEVQHVRKCVQWALKHNVGLTVLGGGHSGHCLWPNVVAVDLGAFDHVHIMSTGEGCEREPSPGLNFYANSDSIVVVESGCKTGDIIRKTMAAGLTVPLGARPSVGAGLWLQGGIGHLARLHGLACDAIVGAVVVGVDSGQVLCVGFVPGQYQPAGAVRPENETDLLWAIRGAGTNFGIVISVVFKACTAPTYSVRNLIIPLSDKLEARRRLGHFDMLIARKLPQNSSADAYLYWDNDHLHLGVTILESSTPGLNFKESTHTSISTVLGPTESFRVVDGVELFETEMYISGMHDGHGGRKTSSFKRCLFLKDIASVRIANILVDAIENRPTPLCYLHLLQGGGAVSHIEANATAFGCRDWHFASIITGVWPRDQDGSKDARAAVQWVYDVTNHLLPFSSGAYGADLGPDPRDAALAANAFGPNLPRLARLKHQSDPRNVLAYACPLPKASVEQKQKLILLITGESGAGKDHCANIWASILTANTHKSLTARVVSISDMTKQEYAEATGADLNRLLGDRAYKEQHRPSLTAFFQDQVRQRPHLPEEHFLNVVSNAVDVDVLLITGMRDEAPVAALSHLVPDIRLFEIRVEASEAIRRMRRECHSSDDNGKNSRNSRDGKDDNNSGKSNSDSMALDYCPSFIFDNDNTGNNETIKMFAERHLLPYFHDDLRRLANMVRRVPDFPRPGIEFRHVLDISQQPGGLALCASLLQTHFTGDWAKVDRVACCGAGGFVYAPALAARVGIPLALIREAGKLPPPTISGVKSLSHISSLVADESREEGRIEIGKDVIPRGASVVVIDDVLATGRTLCAVLQLLGEVGVSAENVSVLAVAEFPIHCGRGFLRQRGFDRVHVQSLLVFGGD